nr:MAG TPA: hypothetical protein [Caudoviricetes sp.]
MIISSIFTNTTVFRSLFYFIIRYCNRRRIDISNSTIWVNINICIVQLFQHSRHMAFRIFSSICIPTV